MAPKAYQKTKDGLSAGHSVAIAKTGEALADGVAEDSDPILTELKAFADDEIYDHLVGFRKTLRTKLLENLNQTLQVVPEAIAGQEKRVDELLARAGKRKST